MLKRVRNGTYHKMISRHLNQHLDEFLGRHNQRPSDTIDQISALASGEEGKRLRYRDLIG